MSKVVYSHLSFGRIYNYTHGFSHKLAIFESKDLHISWIFANIVPLIRENTMQKNLFLVLNFLFVLILCCPANVTKDINMRFKDVRQGLSHQTVNCFYQDEFGFLWIGTQDGLNRFDGRKFDIFKPDNTNPHSININNIRQVCGNKDGLLFLRSLQSVTIYDIRLNRFKVLREGEVTGIYYAHEMLWVTTSKAIYRYHNLEQSPELFFSFASEKHAEDILINNLVVCKDQTVIIGTSSKGVFFIDRFKHLSRKIEVGAINSITEDRTGTIWVSTRNKGLVRLTSDGKQTHYRYNKVASTTINHDNVRHVAQANDSLLYIGTYAGLQTLNLSTGEFTDCEYDLNVEAADIRSIIAMHYDTSGTLWMGTFYQGIQYYNVANDAFHFYRSSTAVGGQLNSYIISSIAEDSSGRIWFGSEGGGLNYYDMISKRFYPLKKLYSEELSFKIVKSLHYEKEANLLWVASLYQGVNRINLSNGHIDYISEEIYEGQGRVSDKAYNLVKIVEFPGHDSLLIAAKGGLLVLDKKQLKLHHFSDPSLSSKHLSQVWDMTFDKEGDLWVTTSFDLVRINMKKGVSSSYPFSQIAQSTAQHHINHILCDRKGRIWLGSTGSGIYLYDKEKNNFVGYGMKHGLENGFITGLIESPLEGSIYVATNGGFSKFSLASETFENYSRHSDFPLNNVNDGGLYISSNDDIYICGLSGIVSIAQEKLNKQFIDYNVFVKRVLVDNMEIQPLDSLGLISETVLYEHQLTLPPKYSSVTFEIASNALNNISNIGLEYKLEGFDHEYIKAGDNTMITYTNLHPGKYVFRVRGDQPRIHDEAIPVSSFELTVEAPVYQRTWFITLVLLTVILIAAYIIRLFWIRKSLRHSLLAEKREKEYIENVNQSKLRFFTNVSHEFRTPLTLISSQLEMLLMHKDILPDVYNKILDIYKNSRRMNALVDEVIDIRKQDQGYLKLKISKVNIVALMEEICVSFYSYAQLNKVELRFSSSLQEAMLYIDRTQIEKVFYNLLSNAFKYTKAGDWIAVEIEEENDNDIAISVKNWGIGIEKTKLKHVFERFWQDDSETITKPVKSSGIGLAVAKGIVELHQGIIEVESEPNAVTCFKVTLRRDAHIDPSLTSLVDPYLTDQYEVESQEISEIAKPDQTVKMLIVEDNQEMRKILSQIFGQIYEVHTASNGQEGLELAASLQPQLILSDIMMPVMSGLEMCEKLKSNLQTSHIPIVLLTARNREEHTLEGLQTGADDYISKPFNIKILVARCNNIIQSRKLLQQRFAGNEEPKVEELPFNAIDKKMLMDATAIVESYIDNSEFDVATFAREMCMSRTLLFTKLKALTGQTPNDFVLSIRLKKATEKLRNEPDALIADIAFEYGFSNPSYFIRCFKNAFGITPAAYRKNNGK